MYHILTCTRGEYILSVYIHAPNDRFSSLLPYCKNFNVIDSSTEQVTQSWQLKFIDTNYEFPRSLSIQVNLPDLELKKSIGDVACSEGS